jgi:hypothetical protein
MIFAIVGVMEIDMVAEELTAVCTENPVRVDLMRESLNGP